MYQVDGIPTDEKGYYMAKNLKQYFKSIEKIPQLTREEEHEIAKRSHKGDKEATQKLILCNLRFVVSVARNYEHQGIPLVDLINEGNLGLYRAAKRYDHEKRVKGKRIKFISYGVWWVRQGIMESLAYQSRIMKIPLNRIPHITKINKAKMILQQELRREPSFDELYNYVKKEYKMKKDDLILALRIEEYPISLNSSVGEGDDKSTLLDLIKSNDPSPSEESEKQLINNAIVGILDEHLTKRDADIMKMYHGIDYDKSYTLEEIAVKYRLTREGIRQIKNKSIRDLKKKKVALKKLISLRPD